MSDKTLDQLIASLKNEAIDVAEKESEEILKQATLEAQKIVQAAELKKNTILAEAKQEAEAIISKGESTLRLVGRDYNISVRNELIQMFQSVLEAEVQKVFTPDLLKTAIVKVIENIGSDVDLQLSSEFSKELADYIHSRLQSSEQTISIIEDNSVLNKISISQSTEGWSYEITAEEVAKSLQAHLNSKWVDILKKEA